MSIGLKEFFNVIDNLPNWIDGVVFVLAMSLLLAKRK